MQGRSFRCSRTGSWAATAAERRLASAANFRAMPARTGPLPVSHMHHGGPVLGLPDWTLGASLREESIMAKLLRNSSRPVVSVQEDATVEDAVKTMVEHRIGAVIVLRLSLIHISEPTRLG